MPQPVSVPSARRQWPTRISRLELIFRCSGSIAAPIAGASRPDRPRTRSAARSRASGRCHGQQARAARSALRAPAEACRRRPRRPPRRARRQATAAARPARRRSRPATLRPAGWPPRRGFLARPAVDSCADAAQVPDQGVDRGAGQQDIGRPVGAGAVTAGRARPASGRCRRHCPCDAPVIVAAQDDAAADGRADEDVEEVVELRPWPRNSSATAAAVPSFSQNTSRPVAAARRGAEVEFVPARGRPRAGCPARAASCPYCRAWRCRGRPAGAGRAFDQPRAGRQRLEASAIASSGMGKSRSRRRRSSTWPAKSTSSASSERRPSLKPTE